MLGRASASRPDPRHPTARRPGADPFRPTRRRFMHGSEAVAVQRRGPPRPSSRASRSWPRRSRSRSARAAATSCSTRSGARPTVTKDGVTVAKEIELEDAVREHGRPDGARGRLEDLRRRRRRHDHGDRARRGHLPRGPQERHRRLDADGHQARHRQGGRDGRRRAQEAQSKTVKDNKEIEQVATISANGDTLDRQDHRRGDGQGRQGRHDHGRGGQVDRDHARRGRGHAVRQGLHLAVLRDREGRHGGRRSRTPTSCSTRRSSRT